MKILNTILTWVMQKRIHQIELFQKYPIDVQEEWRKRLIQTGKSTEFGIKFGFGDIKTLDEFQSRVPISSYEKMYPYIERIMKGEQNVLWPSEIKWFAKSSGTTNARSKFIPVSPESLEDCHYKGGKDLVSIYVNNHPDSQMFSGKGLAIGGSHQINHFDPDENSYYGDVSAVIMQNLPMWAQWVRTPSLEIALMDEWEEKIERMSAVTSKEDVTNLSGIPTWTILLIRRILEVTGKSSILEVWPNLEVFFHGAVSFDPYRELFKTLIPSNDMRYVETYNASEGFFGIQDLSDSNEMLLMLDYGIYYEFIPLTEIDNDDPKVVALSDVELGTNYAVVISTNAGLWRYMIGDTIKFTSKLPFRFRISGRTKHFINAFGEEVIIENADYAITRACQSTGAIIDNYSAGPVYLDISHKGGHEWVIEFVKLPDDMDRFTLLLDEYLRKINSDYDAKRYHDMALITPIVHSVPKGTFYNWMKSQGKLGGQQKVPRLSNNRDYIDDILDIVQTKSMVS